MDSVTIPSRPFATENVTGLALPDGIFEITIGRQRINAYFKNAAATTLSATRVYVESVSHPGIVVVARTHLVGGLPVGASVLLGWAADFSAAAPGKHLISFVVDSGGVKTRIIKHIMVTRISFDPTSRRFGAEVPEGLLTVGFERYLGPKNIRCCKRESEPEPVSTGHVRSFLDWIRFGVRHDPNFQLCLRHYLPAEFSATVTPTPPYAGQYGDLPFQDPWWKVVLAIIAVLLAIGAAIAEAAGGSGEITVTGGGTTDGSDTDCCGVEVSGGGTSYAAAGLLAAAAAVATIAAASDVRDPWRRGQDHTPPAAGELTIGETLDFKIDYIDPVALGRPFSIKADWTYTRNTTGATYHYHASDLNTNQHVLKKIEIDASDVVRTYKREPWIVRARFYGVDDRLLAGDRLFVQCLLAGPNGQFRSIVLQDSGMVPDAHANDGIYTGIYFFNLDRDPDPRGIWTYFVIAQDLNRATPDLSPEQAAQIIGGLVVTHNLAIDFNGGTCPLIGDGHVNVV